MKQAGPPAADAVVVAAAAAVVVVGVAAAVGAAAVETGRTQPEQAYPPLRGLRATVGRWRRVQKGGETNKIVSRGYPH